MQSSENRRIKEVIFGNLILPDSLCYLRNNSTKKNYLHRVSKEVNTLQASFSKKAKMLERAGVLEVYKCGDPRRKYVRLTDKGKTIAKNIIKIYEILG